MTQIKELSTADAMYCLLIHLAVLFLVIFPVGVLVLFVIKLLIQALFSVFGYEATWFLGQWLQDPLESRVEACTLLNCTAGFVALVVFMVRALLKMGELPSSTDGIFALHVRLGLRMIALPILTALICTLTSLAVFFIFSGVDSFVDTYLTIAWIVLFPTAIGTWIWVWRGVWITSIPSPPST
ncbi:MAG: hypothetical protein F4227_04265 [Gammaproteobacteria bacterium]|nr:hypothetical protein [Gammaproteobacteria bacterium]MYF02190.1 hypothetical protein [Gammaproteobacteria bacterium]MYI76474.1 hypothetical protein [Gammaproteobacteria bacterium]